MSPLAGWVPTPSLTVWNADRLLNGLLCRPNDAASLEEQLRRACCHPLFSRGEVDAETLTRMRDYLSPAEMNRRFFAAYEETLALSKSA